jgi:hypothetical protein
MALLRGDTTQCLTNDACLIETGFKTGHGRSAWDSAGLSTMQNKSTTLQLTMPWLRG